ncbi:hypothetical protein STPYR_12748 [uncultured Stenotrophomonas sp.]|uniref:Uncharacterized protein n=1 Tax=uncultured Stenotrophomonas sp. TaxID=165438 RepID=A0A1Y5Q998_9GAMM|nr:hypothetical protein STPYR_12748 [uncultured Stenotrophomonas sp.]
MRRTVRIVRRLRHKPHCRRDPCPLTPELSRASVGLNESLDRIRKMEMSFDLFGFDCIPDSVPGLGIWGFWVGCITTLSGAKRSLFCVHRDNSTWHIEVLWMRAV